jgi:hypothetical protein
MSEGRFAGVDWASAEHAVCVVDERGRIVEGRRFAHDEAGIRALCGPPPGRRLPRGRTPRRAVVDLPDTSPARGANGTHQLDSRARRTVRTLSGTPTAYRARS